MTNQKKMAAKLGELGIPHREISVYGSQIVIECWSEDAAKKFATVVGLFAKIRGLLKTTVDAKENKNTCLNPSQVIVWRLYAAMT